ncbi:hypothetical protein [Streptomyces amritsarensis]|uniref:hypothetical protein n=1 Tax=Streptomyces amritsarensis TaxID=681158 RepID=UPI0036C3A728
MADPVRTRTDGDIARVASLLQQTHAALGIASDVVRAAGGVDTVRRMADLGRTLRALRGEADDLAATELGAGPQEKDRESVLTALYVTEDVARIGVLIEQVGEIAGARSSGPRLAAPVRVPVGDLGDACLRLLARARDVLQLAAPPAVMDRDLADVTARQRGLSRLLLTGGTVCPVRDAVDAAVLGRCYEECAHRAAAMARIAALLREGAPQG